MVLILGSPYLRRDRYIQSTLGGVSSGCGRQADEKDTPQGQDLEPPPANKKLWVLGFRVKSSVTVGSCSLYNHIDGH